MNTRRTRRPWLTFAGLVLGAAGIGVLWAAGIQFPVAVPPGMVILLVGALFVALAPWRWVPGVGAFLGLFVIVGFLLSPTGISNLTGDAGAAVSAGQAIQLVGTVAALVTGVLALRTNYRERRGHVRRAASDVR